MTKRGKRKGGKKETVKKVRPRAKSEPFGAIQELEWIHWDRYLQEEFLGLQFY